MCSQPRKNKEKKFFFLDKHKEVSYESYIRWLECELFKLKAENAYLKELHHLHFLTHPTNSSYEAYKKSPFS